MSLRPLENKSPKSIPIIIPHTIITTNCAIPLNATPPSKYPPIIISISTKKNATAVPSLNKLSHSNIRLNLCGVPKSLNNASTATGSVAEIITPNSNEIIIGTSIPSHPSAK